MSKMKQIAALTAMLVGVIMYASPAKSAVCFLPDDDGSCGGGDIEISDGSDSDDNKTEEKCEDFPVSATEYEKMKNCFDLTPCTKSKTNEVKYKKGAQKENTTWSNGICCTNGEKYFSKQGQCCPATGCTCSGGRVWNPSTEQCECPEGKEFVGGVCTCAGNTVPDSDGNCILPAGCTYEYRQATTADSCGLTDLNTNYQCASTINGCNCYNQLQKVSSVWVYMTGHVFPYNKISNKSATCVDENNVTRYQTICQGTPKSKCSTNGGYEFKPNGCVSDTYNNGFEVKGDEWGDCVKKDCTYEYTRIGVGDTMGDKDYNEHLNNLFNGHDRKTNGTGVYWKGPGDFNENHNYSGYQMYSKISKDSDICYDEKNTIRYETICPGTAKVYCKEKKFVPNGCSSEQYVAGRMTIESMEFGDCVRVCDVSEGLYDTEDECKKADPKYPECKSVDNCYVQIKKGWGIHYTHKFENADTRAYSCTKNKYENGVNDKVGTNWEVSVSKRDNWGLAEDLDGNKHWNINGYEGEVRYPAGEYRICFNYAYSGITHYIWPNYIHLAKTNGDACDYRLNDHQWHPENSNKEFCSDENLNTISPSYSVCMIATFEDYEEYYVEGSFNSVSGYTCNQVKYSPY